MMRKLLYIDLFCGAGGTSTGVEAATLGGQKCAHVIACVNHDPHAIASHSLDTAKDYTPRYFIEITAHAYGGEAIRQLAESYGINIE